ncbi:carboxymuconolactone decarboxylase family protein [Chloroflexota bacterium]
MSNSERWEQGWRVVQQLTAGQSDGKGGIAGQVFPDFWKMHMEHLYGEVYARPGLALRERIMVNLTGLVFQKFDFGIANCMRWALNNGVTREGILEIIMHVAHYGGWPCGVNAIHVAKEVFAEKE